jgi:hypothetical protein
MVDIDKIEITMCITPEYSHYFKYEIEANYKGRAMRGLGDTWDLAFKDLILRLF